MKTAKTIPARACSLKMKPTRRDKNKKNCNEIKWERKYTAHYYYNNIMLSLANLRLISYYALGTKYYFVARNFGSQYASEQLFVSTLKLVYYDFLNN
jgi:hypothetical protein